jgi:calcium/calmodulin-dependent protein kinase I
VSQDVTREVALKAIAKKKVKGNEESVWSEMQVLQGLDHPNIVRPPLFSSSYRVI